MRRLHWFAVAALLIVLLALLGAGAVGFVAWLSLPRDPIAAVLTYEIDTAGAPASTDLAENVSAAIQRRMPRNRWGGAVTAVRVVDQAQVAIDVHSQDPEVLDTVRRRAEVLGTLEFRVLVDRGAERELVDLADAQPRTDVIKRGDRAVARWVPIEDDPETVEAFANKPRLLVRPQGQHPASGQPKWDVLVVLDRYNVTGAFLNAVRPSVDQLGRPCVDFWFNSEGAAKFGGLTSDHLPVNGIERHLGILLDDFVVAAPVIQSTITDRGEITGNFTQQEVDDLAAVLNAGSLPAKVRLVSEEMLEPDERAW